MTLGEKRGAIVPAEIREHYHPTAQLQGALKGSLKMFFFFFWVEAHAVTVWLRLSRSH